MVRKDTHHDAAEADLYEAAEAAIASGRVQKVQFKGTTLTIGPSAPPQGRASRSAEALTPAEREEILRATFGAWKGQIDGEQLKRDLRELQQDDADARSR